MGRGSADAAVVVARRVKQGVEGVIWAACLLWLVWWFLSPEPHGDDDHLSKNTHSRFFRTDGREGSILIYQTMPFVIVAILSFAVFELRAFIRSKESIASNQKANQSAFRFSSISTYPLWVHSPFGVLTVAELLFIISILFVVFYHFGRVIYLAFQQIDNGTAMHYGRIVSNPWTKLNNAAYYFGTAGIVPFSLLWIPVSRGSPFLRLLGIPFEKAVKYHIWLAVFMMVMLTLHSIGYIVFYMATGQTTLITGWLTEGEDCAVVAGLVAWVVGMVMWITSLSFFRRRWYEFFFGVHHLYIIFSLFWLYHAVWNYHFFIIPILLFLVDRFLRMFQSRQFVDVLSAKVLESGAVELNLARNQKEGLVFHSLSTWCIKIPCVSKLQWHFFSAISTPMKEDKDLSIVIKPLGAWTKKLCEQLKATSDTKLLATRCPFSFKARVEGPYGDESDFYLKYQTLVLVGGGIGVTPLLAIMRDILQRYKISQQKCLYLPTSIELYHCVRTPKELCVLNDIDPHQLLPNYDQSGLIIQVHAFITSKFIEDYSGQLATHASSSENNSIDLARFGGSNNKTIMRLVSPISDHKPQGVSVISTMGDTKWIASISISSMVGYFVMSGIANLFIVKEYKFNFLNYNRAHIVILCMLLGIFVFGGTILMVWLVQIKKSKEDFSLVQPTSNNTTPSPATYNQAKQNFFDGEANLGSDGGSTWTGELNLCRRPNWKDVFNDLSNQYKGQSVGVLVSGSQSMQEDVANECRRNSRFLLAITPENVAFDFHSVSFDF